MIETVLISFLAIILAAFAQYPKYKNGLRFAFLILTLFMSIRYNFGSDYQEYLLIFQTIEKSSNAALLTSRIEPGWIFINRLFQPIGFFGMIIFITVFEYYVIYRLIKRYVPKEMYWFAVFIFTLNSAFMLVFASMMRQFLAICICLVTVKYIIKKQWIIAILLVLTASLIHTSALVFLPFCFLGFFDISISSKNAIIWFVAYMILYFFIIEIFGDFFYKILELEQFHKYQIYLKDEKTSLGSGLGLVFNMIMYFVVLLHQKYQLQSQRVLFIIFLFYVLFDMFSEIAPLTTRLGYYFSVFSIFCYPLMLNSLKFKLFKYPLIIGYIIITLKTLIDFFDSSGIWYAGFYNYQTIFSASQWM